tara:strand:+ start:118269 stop:119693 length:1425 start_codon:yes stop_codon:yes gene_type:complete
MKRIAPIFFFITSFWIGLKAQDESGLRIGNYSGVNGLMSNPAFSNSSFLSWDLNLIAGGFFVYNGYQYIENTNLIHSIINRDKLTFNSSNPELIASQPSDPLYFDFFDPIRDFDASVNTFITGPSLSLRFRKFATGIYINNRFAFGGNNLDPDLSEPSLGNWQPFEQKSFDPMDAAGMAWTEIGINFSTNIQKRRDRIISLGINLKYNIGYDGFYVDNPNQGEVLALSDTHQVASGGPVEYAFSTGLARDNSTYDPGIRGRGFGMDIGASLILRSTDSRPYRYKIGLSIMDLGYVHFTDNAEFHRIPASTDVEIDYLDLISTLTIEKLVTKASEQVLGDPSASLVGSDFNILTPLALNFSIDYSIHKYWYWASQIVRRMDITANTIERENLLMSSLRYENQTYEFGANFLLYNDVHPRMGIWARLGPFTIGSDNIGSILWKQSKLTGTDIYFAIKLNRYKKKYRENDPLENCNF